MAKQTFTTGQVLTAAQMNSLQSNDFNQTVSVKTASYTLVAADKGTRIEFNTSGSVTCTVNTGIFDAGDTVIIQNRGSGTVTVTAGTATVNTNASLAIGQYGYGTLYFVSASAAIFFADAGGIPASAFTAKGDILVGTGSGTYDKLTVGANNTTIVADSSTSTGLKWAAAASSTPSYTLLNAGGTALTGAATITVSGISGKNEIFVYIDSASSNNSGAYIKVRINGSTTSGDYYYLSAYKAGTADWYGISEYTGDAGALRLPTSTDAGTGSLFVHIYGCNGAGVKPFNGLSWGSENGDTNHEDYHWMGHYTPSTVVTSIAVTSSTGNFDAGTLYVYGA